MKKNKLFLIAIFSILAFSACEQLTTPTPKPVPVKNPEYSITFETINGGGEGKMNSQTIESGNFSLLNINKFTSNENSFLGWSSTPNGNVEYANGASFTMGSGDVILYAVWGRIRIDLIKFSNPQIKTDVMKWDYVYAHEIKSMQIGDFGNNNIEDIENFTALTNLDISHCHISDINSLKYLTALSWLDLKNNQISNIEPLKDLTALSILELRDNQVSNLKPLENLTALQVLHLRNNQISNIDPLKDLTKLIYIDLRNNDISSTDIDSLKLSLPTCNIDW